VASKYQEVRDLRDRVQTLRDEASRLQGRLDQLREQGKSATPELLAKLQRDKARLEKKLAEQIKAYEDAYRDKLG
jgi:predicted nuclease with TOPRIM domain